MKVTKTKHQAREKRVTKYEANIGCNKCPECGETKDYFDWLGDVLHGKIASNERPRGISGGICRYVSIRTGLFKWEQRMVSCYKCETCGAEWESDPY